MIGVAPDSSLANTFKRFGFKHFHALLHSVTLHAKLTLFSKWLHTLPKKHSVEEKRATWQAVQSQPRKFDDRPARRKNHPICPEKLPLGYTLPSGGVPCSKSLRVPC